ncbi:hypothetical protein B0I72DRAFT_137676 [Yarrowia lipolytica]|jgi:hypothetical protein|uniref:YALI0C21516p n=2 Tax=Yarrowia lipolytica TaxID=4952 RepID=Q6CB67_YARLI|nr:YALI0C21516p [Yarrowia lipolytica CLIB122]AOW03206.1 hypothetical protein YALI1_C29676g [Yarrowia lipolytica]KAB8281147.1 hypothetical protein BKA91DRAFT_140731 [Yarrowia lipolytica]KAE8172986.1 hypothetical protein BKA90DRAFT_136369 [Yarrowia lipolytica]KAJ8053705.1 hypothetical protein LXG23DRAFT_23193 [Yarrowia lipolytica]RDW27133.1 hypothetical protein B0I71DRAFT_129713 [Yarrowia lipolytica]|eukprot:XP_502095.1 YALI0C21516p [Yarrowia lipolytica CLIB122]
MFRLLLNSILLIAAVIIGVANYNGLPTSALDVRDSLLPMMWRYSGIEPVNNNCHVVEGVEACEDAKYDEESGLVFMACGNAEARKKWFPGTGFFMDPETARHQVDQIFVFDPKTEKIQNVHVKDFEGHTFTSHGLDVFTLKDGTKIIAAVNHKADASVISFFKVNHPGEVAYIGEIKDDLLKIPNSVALFYTPEGQLGFVATNDHVEREGPKRQVAEILGLKATYLVYCAVDIDNGVTGKCHKVADHLVYPNGIAHIPGTHDFVQSDSRDAKIKHWSWNSTSQKLDLNSATMVGAPMDNVRVIPGTKDVMVAAFPNVLQVMHKYKNMDDKNSRVKTVGLRLNHNEGYKIPHVIHKSNDDYGVFVNTVYNYFPKENKILAGSCFAKGLVVCNGPDGAQAQKIVEEEVNKNVDIDEDEEEDED